MSEETPPRGGSGRCGPSRRGFEWPCARQQLGLRFYFCTVIVAEPVSGGLAESVAVTVMV
jgi:hypothetical protein